MDLDLVGQQSGALIEIVPPESIKDRCCIGFHSQVTDLFVPSIYLLMGAEDLFLSCHDSCSFRTGFLGGYIYWVEEV
jgi:hypothetical protein